MQQIRPFFFFFFSSVVLYAHWLWLLTTCEMSTVMEAEVRVQGSESSEQGGYVHSASVLNLSYHFCLSVFGMNSVMCCDFFFFE